MERDWLSSNFLAFYKSAYISTIEPCVHTLWAAKGYIESIMSADAFKIARTVA